MDILRQAAQALVDRWDTPAWKDVPHTGKYIDALRAALAQPEQTRSQQMRDAGYTRRPRQLPKEDEQEPVAHRIFDGEGGYVFVDGDPSEFEVEWSARYRRKYEPLYTAPPQRKPLTDDRIAQIDWKDGETLHDFARAIEKAHGIGGEE